MFQLTLKRKIFLGFGLIFLLLFANVLAVYFGSNRMSSEIGRMSAVASVNATVLGLDRDIQELRLRVDRFVQSGRESQSSAAAEIFDRLRVKIEDTKKDHNDPEMDNLFDQISLRLKEYSSHFESVISERKLRQDLVYLQLPGLAKGIQSQFAALSDTLETDSFSEQARISLARSQSSFSETEKYLLRYFENPDGELVEFAIESIATTVSHLESSEIPEERIKSLVDSIANYERVGMRAVQATRSYLFLRNVLIAGEESEVSYYSSKLRSRAADRKHLIASQLEATSSHVRTISWVIAFTAFVMSVLIATRLAILIVKPISDLTATFETLSSGCVLTAVPGSDRCDEIGKMATAARIFSDQNRRTRELLAESQKLGSELHKKAALLEATNEELDGFAYVASHDLRSPLRGIKHLAQWIEEDMGGNLSSQGSVYLDNLKKRVSKLEVLLEDLLNFSRVGRINPPKEMVDVATLLENIVSMVDNPNGVKIEWDPNLPVFKTIRPPLEQVFMNLIGNAVKHNDKLENGKVAISCEQEGDRYRFSVRDNGPGISSSNFERIFQMYQRVGSRTVEGSGMGLAIVKKQVELFGGTVKVESAEDCGASFHFTWPVEPDEFSADRETRQSHFAASCEVTV
ncbi:MAG: hypothetical protein KDB00_24410 [Planctomycetales bacterium]|nr:hypothetical protein [Planctomycetales bacterium]